MNINNALSKFDLRKIKPSVYILLTALALLIASFAVFIAFVQINLMRKMTEDLQEMKISIPKKQTPEEFQASLVDALNKLASDRAAQETKEKLAKYTSASETLPKGKHIYGAIDARFTLVEFSDLECPYCKSFHDKPKQLTDASNGNVNWQWMHLPLDFHNPAAKIQAHAAECLAEQKGNRAFWAFLDDVFVQSRGNGQGVSDITAIATTLGADEDDFRACMKDGRFNDKIEAHIEKARQHGINGTPATIIVDNQTGKMQLVAGAQPMQALMSAIAKLKTESDESSGTSSSNNKSTTHPAGEATSG